MILLIGFSLFLYTNSIHAEEKTTWVIEVENVVEFQQELEKNYPQIEVIYTFDLLLEAVAVQASPEKIQQLQQHEQVVSISESKTYQLDHQQNETESPSKLPNYSLNETSVYTGKNVKVGIIDTGIDYTHPDLQKNFRGGFDVIDFDDDPQETLPQQGLPTNHGTHVAGIIGANGKLKGVAPDADIYGYRALGQGGMGTSAQIIAALEMAVKDGMEVINMSLGNQVNSPDDPMAKAVDAAYEQGTLIVTANGNSGPEEWTVAAPATSEHAISVGALAHPQQTPVFHIKDQVIPIRAIPNTPKWQLKKSYPLLVVDNVDKPTPNTHNKILLINSELASYPQIVHKLKGSEAVAAIIYASTEEDPNLWEFVESDVPIAYLTEEEANIVQEEEWLDTQYEEAPSQVAPFSSRGPSTSNWEIKPDVLAPGVEIVSTVPEGYASMNGTSMAAPYITGILALLKEAFPQSSPEQLKQKLFTAVEPGFENTPPNIQGAGAIQVDKLFNQTYQLERKALNFGKLSKDNRFSNQEISITNKEQHPINVMFKVPKREQGYIFQLPMAKKIPPDTTETFEFSAKYNDHLKRNSMQQGYFEVQIDQKEEKLPYLIVHEDEPYPRITGLEWHKNQTIVFNAAQEIDSLAMTFFTNDLYEKVQIELENVPEGRFNEQISIDDLQLGTYTIIMEIEVDGYTTYQQEQINIF
ncbi:S8 family serine peptidase [Halalkalibacillus halophilus]|uniref:S8 family serine peptidase n=1 Tax=Halalkalibacillus halophilus TaxID=392827 RepID=UPI0012EC483E|nr:S8 family serine peptidase [Halalkalibacillus halophilus]